MTLGNQIASLRKQNNITQEALAQKLGVTNQAVSKWESDICCPDVTLLPKIADFFDISLDALFGREAAQSQEAEGESGTLRVVLMQNGKRLWEHPVCKEVTIHWRGDAQNLHSDFSVNCGDVRGNVSAGSTVNCGDVNGPVNAGGNVNCGDIDGAVKAGGNVSCGDIDGDIIAGGKVNCGDIGGNCIVKSADALN